jgi:uncharacterized protein YukE
VSDFDVDINHAGVTQTVVDMQATLRNMQEVVDGMSDQVKKLGGALSATTLTAYDAAQAEINQALNDMHQQAHHLASGVQEVADNTLATDRQIANSFA